MRMNEVRTSVRVRHDYSRSSTRLVGDIFNVKNYHNDMKTCQKL